MRAAESVTGSGAGRVQPTTAWSPALGEEIDLRVYLPPSYGSDQAARYPVLYLLHGRGHHPDDWRRVVPSLDRLINDGVVPPVLGVMPSAPWSNGASWYVDSAYAGSPLGRPVETALVRDLVAHVDATYPTLAVREHRVVGGYSMGGAGALRYLLAHPDSFAAALVMSPAVYDPTPPLDSTTRRHGAFGRGPVPFDAEVYAGLNYPALMERFDPTLPVRLFLVAGDDETAEPMPDDYRHDLDLETAVVHGRAKRVPGITSTFRVLAGGHDWSLWTRALVEGLPFVLRTDEGRVL